MDIHISKHQSKIMEFLWVPFLTYFNQDDFTTIEKDRATFNRLFELQESLREQLQKYDQNIRKHFQTTRNAHLMEQLYCLLLEKGADPKTIEEFYELVLGLSEEEVKITFCRMMTSSEEIQKDDLTELELLALLENLELSSGYNWRTIWNFHHLTDTVQAMVNLYQKILPLYEPYYCQFETKIAEYIRQFDLKKTLSDSPHDILARLENSSRTSCQIFVWSPLFLFQLLRTNTNLDRPYYLYLVPEKQEPLENTIDSDELHLLLKTLSDPIRYNILLQLHHSPKKSKEIAADLSITPANVSFHIQKLLDSNLLSLGDKENKYKVNTERLLLALQHIKKDFGL